MMVRATGDIKLIDAVGANVLLFAEVVGALGEFLVARYHFKGPVGAVALVAGGEGGGAADAGPVLRGIRAGDAGGLTAGGGGDLG